MKTRFMVDWAWEKKDRGGLTLKFKLQIASPNLLTLVDNEIWCLNDLILIGVGSAQSDNGQLS